tara:strand:+ start:28772 stop:29950 length:1179 start_codon:yes stop_codon:yes gene_type:complete
MQASPTGSVDLGYTVVELDMVYCPTRSNFIVAAIDSVSSSFHRVRIFQIYPNTANVPTTSGISLIDGSATPKQNVRVAVKDSDYGLVVWADNPGPYGIKARPFAATSGFTLGNVQSIVSGVGSPVQRVYALEWNQSQSEMLLVAGGHGATVQLRTLEWSATSNFSLVSGVNNWADDAKWRFSGAQYAQYIWIAYTNSASSSGPPTLRRVTMGGSSPVDATSATQLTTDNAQDISIQRGQVSGVFKYVGFFVNNSQGNKLFFYSAAGASSISTVVLDEAGPGVVVADRPQSGYDQANQKLYGFYRASAGGLHALVYDPISSPESDHDQFVGIAQSIGVNGQPALVATTGMVAEGLAGLTPGATYYVTELGALTTTNTGVVVGVAQSPTSILVS